VSVCSKSENKLVEVKARKKQFIKAGTKLLKAMFQPELKPNPEKLTIVKT